MPMRTLKYSKEFIAKNITSARIRICNFPCFSGAGVQFNHRDKWWYLSQ